MMHWDATRPNLLKLHSTSELSPGLSGMAAVNARSTKTPVMMLKSANLQEARPSKAFELCDSSCNNKPSSGSMWKHMEPVNWHSFALFHDSSICSHKFKIPRVRVIQPSGRHPFCQTDRVCPFSTQCISGKLLIYGTRDSRSMVVFFGTTGYQL